VRFAANGYICERSLKEIRRKTWTQREERALAGGAMRDRGPGGTRFRLFPRPPYAQPGRLPDVVYIATPPGSIGPGPSDDRIYLIDPIGKRQPYGMITGPYGTPHFDLPPWRGAIRRPVMPDADGHFDHIPFGTPEFEQAHVFGTIRFTLAVWERYFGQPIQWHFVRDFDRLEVVMLPAFNNAHVGYGFMEVGAHHGGDGVTVPYSLNFDVVAHELGHLIIYGTIGVPTKATEDGEYFGFQEAAADTTAMIAALHFNSLVEHLLEETRGNLFSYNELDRFAELSPTEQIRLASNSVKMSEFVGGWTDEHYLSQPLSGALFDILVDMFQENLVERGLIRRAFADLSDRVRDRPEYAAAIQGEYDAAYVGESEGFRTALLDARDYLGIALAETWKRLSPHFLTYDEVGNILLAVDRALSGGRYRAEITESFDWREIGMVKVGPRLAPPDEKSHTHSARTLLPGVRRRLPKMSFRERMLIARGAR